MTATTASREAERILETFWGWEGDREIPIDPVRVARRLGIGVLEARLDQNVAGMLVKELGQDPSIYLNKTDSKNRKRFTCAHEIGHFTRRSEQSPSLEAVEKYQYVDQRSHLASAGTDPDEIHANQFAAALLMPEKLVKKFHREGLGAVRMAYRFDVSAEAMRYRLQNLGLSDS
jgi:Zn-dependent peptidase ImmA (M78 family)